MLDEFKILELIGLFENIKFRLLTIFKYFERLGLQCIAMPRFLKDLWIAKFSHHRMKMNKEETMFRRLVILL